MKVMLAEIEIRYFLKEKILEKAENDKDPGADANYGHGNDSDWCG